MHNIRLSQIRISFPYDQFEDLNIFLQNELDNLDSRSG